MTRALAGNISVLFNANLTDIIGLASGSISINYKASQDFADGGGDGQASVAWSSLGRALAASGTEDLDLNASLTDGYGSSIVLTKLKALLIKAAATNINDVVVGGAASHPIALFADAASDKMLVKPGGILLLIAPLTAGYPIVAATSDVLTIANSAGTTGIVYDIAVLGSHA